MPWSKYACQLHVYLPLHHYCSLHTDYSLLHMTAYVNETHNPVGFELSSNMHMDYAFGNHTYSLPSMTTYVFLVWHTYFVFCIYTKNFGNCTHVYNVIKC